MADFMNDPSQAPDMGCVAERVSFVVPGAELTLSPVTVASLGVESVAPDGWTEAAEGIWLRGASAADPTALLITAVSGDDVAATVNGLAESEGYDAPIPIDEIVSGDQAWSIFVATQGEVIAAIAATANEGSIYLAVLVTDAREFETLAEPVLLPVIEAFSFVE